MTVHGMKLTLAPLLLLAAVTAASPPVFSAAQSAEEAEKAEPPQISWESWGPEPFERARREEKGVLLSIVNEGCRACSVMDAEVWTDRDVRERVDKLWIPVRVVADDRPDIATRYLLALGVLNVRRAGVPITGFLFYTGEAMWVDIALSAESHGERPGLRQLLLSMNHFWKTRFAEARRNAIKVQGWFDSAAKPQRKMPLSHELVAAMTDEMAKTADLDHGGFGAPPRVANPFCVQAGLVEAAGRGDASLRESALEALMGPVTGGTLDHLEGGFHFAPQSASWEIPTFGKRLDVTASYLRAIADALRVSPDSRLAEAAGSSLDYVLGTLQAPDGGFYVRQAPSRDMNAPFDYYTFRTETLASALGEKDLAWAKILYGVKTEGDLLLGLPPRVILKRPPPDEEDLADAGLEQAGKRIEEKLMAAREEVGRPPVITARYADSTAQAISALLHAGAVLGREDAIAAALKALHEILDRYPRLDQGVPHRLDGGAGKETPPLMQDLAYLGNAILDAYEMEGDASHLEAGKRAAKGLYALFEDPDDGGFFDVIADESGIGYLRFRLKPVVDTEQPSPNAEAARFLDRLARVTGDDSWARGVAPALEMAAGRLSPFGPFSASVLLAMEAHLRTPVTITIGGSGKEARRFVESAWNLLEPSAVIAWSGKAGGGAGAKICVGLKCGSVVEDPDQMAASLEKIRDGTAAASPSEAAP